MKNQLFNTSKACEGGLTSTGCSVPLVRGIYHWIYRWKKARRCFIPIGYDTTRGCTRGTNTNKNRKPRLNWVKAIWFISGNAYKPSGLLQRRYPGKFTSKGIIAREKVISYKALPGYFKTNNQGFSPMLLFEGKSTMVFGCKTRLKREAGNQQVFIKENNTWERGYSYARNQKRVNRKKWEDNSLYYTNCKPIKINTMENIRPP